MKSGLTLQSHGRGDSCRPLLYRLDGMEWWASEVGPCTPAMTTGAAEPREAGLSALSAHRRVYRMGARFVKA